MNLEQELDEQDEQDAADFEPFGAGVFKFKTWPQHTPTPTHTLTPTLLTAAGDTTEEEDEQTPTRPVPVAERPEPVLQLLPGPARARAKTRKKGQPGKNTPPLLELGRVVCFLPASTGQLVVRVGQSRGMNLIWTVDLGDFHPEAETANKFCSIPYRHLLKFATTGLSSHPPPSSDPDTWVWTYVDDQRLPAKRFCDASMRLLTATYLEQRRRCTARDPEQEREDPDPRQFAWSVFLPHERMSVNLLSVFGLFAVREPALNEKLLKFDVFVQ
jgi:hypothetical protein